MRNFVYSILEVGGIVHTIRFIQKDYIMKKINESFTCLGCKREIPPADKTCRNHCPYCFTSQHVDGKTPGDRDTTCMGIMKPIAYIYNMSKPSDIIFQCIVCNKKHTNRVADDDELSDIVLWDPFQEELPPILPTK
jgi:hypothetical protein